MILDTNALSALAERDNSILDLVRPAPFLCVTLISLGEYRYGISLSRKRADLDRWLDRFLEQARVLLPDLQSLPHYAAVRRQLKEAGTPIPANDCWIAALVLQHELPLVTKDQHFKKVKGLRTLTW